MKSLTCLLIVALMFLGGCASIVSKSDYPVAFNSSPDGATITVTDKNGLQLYRGKTPTQITLKSGAGFFSGAKYTVKFEKDGCEPQILFLENQLDGWYIGNILFGGLIGILIVDPATGAMWKLPPSLHASLAENTTSFVIDQDSVQVALFNDVPESMRNKLVKIQ
jgi:hypothetical protein